MKEPGKEDEVVEVITEDGKEEPSFQETNDMPEPIT